MPPDSPYLAERLPVPTPPWLEACATLPPWEESLLEAMHAADELTREEVLTHLDDWVTLRYVRGLLSGAPHDSGDNHDNDGGHEGEGESQCRNPSTGPGTGPLTLTKRSPPTLRVGLRERGRVLHACTVVEARRPGSARASRIMHHLNPIHRNPCL